MNELDGLLNELNQSNKKLKIAIKALKNIKNWDDDLEDEYGDPGLCAKEALSKINIIDEMIG